MEPNTQSAPSSSHITTTNTPPTPDAAPSSAGVSYVSAALLVLAALVIGGLGMYIYLNPSLVRMLSVPSESTTSTSESSGDSSLLQAYSGSAFTFTYPKILTVSEVGDEVRVSHSIPYKHGDFCDGSGLAPQKDNLTDINLTLRVFDKGLVDTANTVYPGFTELQGNSFKITPGYVDVFRVGSLNGFRHTAGVEGCGSFTYYFPVSSTKTLVVTRAFIPELTSGSTLSQTYLSLPGIIPPNKEESIFIDLLTSLQVGGSASSSTLVENKNAVSAKTAIFYLSTPNPLDNQIEGYDIDRDPSPRDILGDEYPSKIITRKEAGLHNSQTDCWVINNKRVYELTNLLPHVDVHPSVKRLQEMCGTDITAKVAGSPVEPGSLNTARVKYALSYLNIGRISE